MLTQRGGRVRRGGVCVGVLRRWAGWWRKTSETEKCDIDHHMYMKKSPHVVPALCINSLIIICMI